MKKSKKLKKFIQSNRVNLLLAFTLLISLCVTFTIFLIKKPVILLLNDDFFNALGALATATSVLISLILALHAFRAEKTESARFISCWITTTYSPNSKGTGYIKTTTLHIANQGHEPAFRANVDVFIGYRRQPVGPLSAPHPINVIPPQQELTFDLTNPLLPFSDTFNPQPSLSFSDAKGKRWLREEDGSIQEISEEGHWKHQSGISDELECSNDERIVFNPIIVTLEFLKMLSTLQQETTGRQINNAVKFLYNSSPLHDSDTLIKASQNYCNYNSLSMVDYPVPCVAYVKITNDQNLLDKVFSGDRIQINVSIVTLVFNKTQGWRIYSIGVPTDPSAISFSANTTN